MINFKKERTYSNQQNKFFKLNFDPNKNYLNEYKSLLNSLYGLQYMNTKCDNPIFTFGIKSNNNGTDFYIILPNDYIDIFKKKYAIIDPHFEFEEINDPLSSFSSIIKNNKTYHINGYYLSLVDNDPKKKLKTNGCEKTFLSNLLNSMNNINNSSESIIEISLKVPFNKQIIEQINNKVVKGLIIGTNIIMKGISTILDNTITNGQLNEYYKDNNEKKENINNEIIIDCEPQFNVSIRLMSKSTNKIESINNIKAMATAFADLSYENSLIPIPMNPQQIEKRNIQNKNLLTTSEIVQFLHLPDKNISSENMNISNCRKLYDKNVPSKGIIYGTSNNRNIAFPMVPITVKNYTKKYNDIKEIVDNICKPRLVLGQMGTGKSEWIINYVISLAKLGLGIIVVDPKNDTQQRLIESLPNELIKKVEYINFGDTKYPPGMNIFKKRTLNDPTENSLIVTSFISLMKKEFGHHWGFRIQRTLQMTAEAILLNDCPTLNEFELMLTEPIYRGSMIYRMKSMINNDNIVGKAHIKKLLKYWKRIHEKDQKDIDKEIEPVMNQIGVFLSNRLIKAIVSQKESVDFRKIADEGKIVIINIPEGTLGDNTKLLSSMINKSIWLDLQSRANIDISKRYPISWIIDEAHEIVDDEFISVLTKSRAYRLGLTLATQGLNNFNMRNMKDINELITTNCKNKICFRLGYSDSRAMAEEYEPLNSNDLGNCPDYSFYAKVLLENGSVSNPFFCQALYPAKKIRNYDKYISKHQSGRLTINEIEDDLEERLDSIKLFNKLNERLT